MANQQSNDTLRNLLISAGVFLLIMAILPRLLPPPPMPPTAEPVIPSQAGVAPSDVPPGDLHEEPGRYGPWKVVEADMVRTQTLGLMPREFDPKNPPEFRMSLEVSNVGASVASARLADHRAALHSEQRYELLTPVEYAVPGSTLQTAMSLAIEKINIDGQDVMLHDKRWQMDEISSFRRTDPQGDVEQGIRLNMWVDIQRSDQPELRVWRTLDLPRQSPRSKRHDLYSEIRVQNLASAARRIVVSFRGCLGIPQSSARMDDRIIDIGVRNGTGRVQGTRKPLPQSERNGADVSLYRLGADKGDARLTWAATGNTYFTCTVAPLDASGNDSPGYIAQVSAVDLDGDLTTVGDVTVRFVTTTSELSPGGTQSYPVEIYLGEKDPGGFKKTQPYAARDYYFQIKAGFGMCTFGFLVELMIWLLNTLYLGVRDYGVAIIILVLIVRTLLHPITKKGQINMVKMQKRMGDFAPKLEEIKKKFGNDKAKLQQETMRLYREEGINPAGQMLGCLPLFLQMPIWIALYLSLSNNIRMRHEPFLFTWVRDLTAQDALYTFASPLVIPLLGWQLESFNLLPLLMALFLYMQTKSQPRPEPNPNMSDQQRAQQEMMQKMMPMMSIMMLIFFYKAPSGLNLYIMFSSLFGWIEQKRIRAHIKEQEAAGTLLKPKAKDDEPKRRKRPDEMSFFEKLQKMAEDAQKARPAKPSPKKGRR